MALIAETIGMPLPGSAATPAVHADRLSNCEKTGALAAQMALNGGPKPLEVVTPAAIRNAQRVLLAVSGLTNAVVHMAVVAGRIDDPNLGVAEEVILVLQNAGPKSAAGILEAGYLPIPKKLAQAGVKDMVRLSDARMSGTAFGTVVLHVSPEAAVGGPLGLVRNGDRNRLSAKRKRIDLLVDEATLAQRAIKVAAPSYRPLRGYLKPYQEHVMSATEGCDFDFLEPKV